MTYPKVCTAGPNQSVVVANEEQEKALPKEYGGKAEGKSYAEMAAPAVEGPAAPAAATAKATTKGRKAK